MASANHVPDRRPVTNALVTLLQTATGRPIGNAKTPPNDSGDETIAPEIPYAIVYSLSSSFSGPPLSWAERDGSFRYQVTCVGLRGDQAEWMSDLVTDTIVGRDSAGHFVHDLPVSGMVVLGRETAGDTGPLTRNDLLYQVAVDFRVRVSADTSIP